MYEHPEFVWLVFDRCDCGEPACYSRTEISVFTNEQTAKQEADQRTKRYGGMAGRPDMHIDKIEVSKKTTGY